MSHSLFVSIARRQIAQLWQLEFDFLIDNCAGSSRLTRPDLATIRLWIWPTTSVPHGLECTVYPVYPVYTLYILKFSSSCKCKFCAFALLSQPRQQIQLYPVQRHGQGGTYAEIGFEKLLPKLPATNIKVWRLPLLPLPLIHHPVCGNTSMPKRKKRQI